MQTLPVIPLRGVSVLPGEVIHCDAGRKKTLLAIQAAASADGLAYFCTQKDPQKNELTIDDLPCIGTVCRIRQVFRIQGEGLHMLVTGLNRGIVEEFTSDTPYFEALVSSEEEEYDEDLVSEALKRKLLSSFKQATKDNNRLTHDQKQEILSIKDAVQLGYAIAGNLLSDSQKKQRILEEKDIPKRLLLLAAMLSQEAEIRQIEKELDHKIHARIEQNQREYFLREKLKAIHEELGDVGEQEADEYQKRLEAGEYPAEVKTRLEKEIKRFRQLPFGAHEAPMISAYIECLLELPWTQRTEDNFSLENAQMILDKDHYGMQKIKERILEYLAVCKLVNRPNGQILCLVGPPGVGKTSIAAAIAQAMGRRFVRMSLGGVRDEAEIRGHRRTYIGAMPGRVINAMRQAGTMNPVLLFDEIDKLGSDYKGDPTSAMLEVLDSAQNFAFRDHFLELPYDLSHAMILTTANDAQAIPRPLYDRMEIIQVPGYLDYEKLEIAKNHLLPRQIAANGMKKSMLRITDGQIANIISAYTKESGVRELDRMLGAVCRKAACEIVDGKKRVAIGRQKLTDYLGQPKYRPASAEKKDAVGLVNGLAWTSVGGETLSVEAAVTPGNGSLQLTGHLGDVMQESGKAALTYIRGIGGKLGLAPDFYQKIDIHIHVPEGAVPKDGPSAGVTMATALASALTQIPVRGSVAMTGEITLRGRVLAIGGLREKLLAAIRAGVTTVLLPEDNRIDLEEVPKEILNALDIRFVSDLEQVLQTALAYAPNTLLENKKLPVYVASNTAGVICRKESL